MPYAQQLISSLALVLTITKNIFQLKYYQLCHKYNASYDSWVGSRTNNASDFVYPSLSSSAVRRGSLPDGDNTKQTNRRSSLPTYTQSRHGTSSEIQKQHHGSARRDSTSSNPQQRKFSRDSIDLDLVIEDVDEMDTEADDIDNSIILEEDEDNVDYEVLKANKYCKIDETYSFFKQFPFLLCYALQYF